MKKRTMIISDLHLGGGTADPGDDHVYQNGQLSRFVTGLTDSAQGQRGEIELFINGDFLEFAQTLQDAYRSTDSNLWCSEAESLEKLEVILRGHQPSFDALGRLMDQGNAVMIAAGNHDVDLFWPAVQRRLKAATRDSLAFEVGSEWVPRHGGRLQIAHGHIDDPANTFKNWANPIRGVGDTARLEMCPGTLFMVKFVNGLEQTYPFADNLHPVQKLAKLLLREEKSGFFAVGWALLRFLVRHPKTMGIADPNTYGARLLARVHKDDGLASVLCTAAVRAPPLGVQGLRARVRTEQALAQFILEYWPQLEASGAFKRLAPASGSTLGGAAGDKTLSVIKAGGDFGREALRRIAKNRAGSFEEAQIIVMGHTHVPDDYEVTHKVRYLNPGSWTRYVDMDAHPGLGLKDLQDEGLFPYSLKYVQVDLTCTGTLVASLETFEEQRALFS